MFHQLAHLITFAAAASATAQATFTSGVITGGGFPTPSYGDARNVVPTGGSGGGSTGGGFAGTARLTAALENQGNTSTLRFFGDASHFSTFGGFTSAGTRTYAVTSGNGVGQKIRLDLSEPKSFVVSPGPGGTVEFVSVTGVITGSTSTSGTLSAGTYDIDLNITAELGNPQTMDWRMVLSPPPPPPGQIVRSDFSSSAEGWTVVDLEQIGWSVVGTYAVTWQATGGNPGGYISSIDPSGNDFRFSAPAAFLGDKSAAYGGRLDYDLFDTSSTGTSAPGVIVKGAGQILFFSTPPPATSWTHRSIPLTPAGWRIGDWSTGPEPTVAQFQATLANVTELSIDGDWTNGDDFSGLDNAAIYGPCYANCDNSTSVPILNVNDFICFQHKYASSDPYANCDGSTVSPVLNVNDFICFQAKFAAGCP